MTEYTDLFVRDTLQDTGIIPSSGSPYYSPDIIPYSQVADPQTFFSANYNQDVSQNVEYGVYNYIYLRAKNLDSVAQNGQLKLYWSQTSLVMFPDQWVNNVVNVGQTGNPHFSPLTNIAPGAIGVSPVPFVWTPTTFQAYGYCMIGQVITAQHPNDIPTANMTWAEFVCWVRTHPNICWRNLHIVNNHPDPQYDRLAYFANTEQGPRPMTLRSTCVNLPVGTTINQVSAPVGMNQSTQITQTPQDVYASATVPAGFEGSVQITAILPTGGSWPSNGDIQNTLYVGTEANEPELFKFGDDWSLHTINAEQAGLSSSGKLVQVGNFGILFR